MNMSFLENSCVHLIRFYKAAAKVKIVGLKIFKIKNDSSGKGVMLTKTANKYTK